LSVKTSFAFFAALGADEVFYFEVFFLVLVVFIGNQNPCVGKAAVQDIGLSE
jgi:hypothetical protein